MLAEDLVGGLGPDVGAGVVVPGVDPGADVGVELAHRGVGAAAQFLGGQLGEPALDEVEPGRAGRGEVQDEAGMVCQPTLYRRCLVGGGVVEHDVDSPDRRAPRRRSSSGTPGTPGRGAGRAASRSPCRWPDPARHTGLRCRAGRSRGWPAPACRAASGTPAAVRLSAWIWVFSSTQSTIARSGGSR